MRPPGRDKRCVVGKGLIIGAAVALVLAGEALWPPIGVDPATPTGVEKDIPTQDALRAAAARDRAPGQAGGAAEARAHRGR